jgi:signal transduction histidine kinase/ActR/RegA family two-component response regulator
MDEWTWLGNASGDVARLMRERVDWAKTSLGPVSGWPANLKANITTMLHSRHPMFLWWGPDLVQFYNDGYVPSFGEGRHPSALGQRGKDCWEEIWPIIGPEIDGVLVRGDATYHEDALVPIFRNGRMEEVYWTYGYSPVCESDGSRVGVLVVVTETTSRVIARRRLHTAGAVAESTSGVTRVEELARAAAQALAVAPEDAPWAMAMTSQGAILASYGVEPAKQAQLAALALEAQRSARAPNLEHGGSVSLQDGDLMRFDVSALELTPSGPWPESTQQAVILTARADERTQVPAFVVAGVSPRLTFDLAYQDHFRGIQRQLGSAAVRIASLQAMFAAERAREELLLQAPMAAALLIGPEWRYELANPFYERMIGRSVVGRTWRECFPELRGGPVEEILQRVYREGVSVVSTEQLVPLARERDGVVEERFFDFNIIPVRSDAGHVYGMMIVAVEMTKQVQARRELERTAAEREVLVRDLRRSSRAKDEFLAMLGHELRNPLAPIATALRLMEMRGTTELEREREVIGRQVQHLTRLVDDLLDVARIASGKIELTKSVVELLEVVRRAVEVSESLFEQKKQRLSWAIPAQGLPIDVDVARMTQVIGNLLTNASKYSEPQTCVTVSAERQEDRILLRVADAGIGIDQEMLPTVFDLFSQAPQSVDRSRGGLGLGLSIVRNLMLLHGGSVSVESGGRGCGSTFSIVLPVAQRPALHDGQVARETPVATEAQRRVLIVDDNHDAAELLASMLTAAGHIAQTAADGPEALAMLDSFTPDVAVLDIGLPVMDGYELARRVRAHPTAGGAVLFALTGYGQDADRRRALEAGFDRHFVKPVDQRAIAKAIGGKRAKLA